MTAHRILFEAIKELTSLKSNALLLSHEQEKFEQTLVDLRIVLGLLTHPKFNCACCDKELTIANSRELEEQRSELLCNDCVDNEVERMKDDEDEAL